MTAQDNEFSLELSRRKLLAAAGIGSGAAGVTIPSSPYVNDNLGSPAAGDTTERRAKGLAGKGTGCRSQGQRH